ncbi:hypothetical protein [Pseudonocardia humida]|uniref:Uncharacterized protein n=1 Tax=Pseudonocardia humida TaxID=2800819 RepID=A0ABT1A5I5_9PSEU|nr:hypothetical protein [Pseudonocardia humida]MCO1658272.1 hypothetical protein [Pseudonocardia humida]
MGPEDRPPRAAVVLAVAAALLVVLATALFLVRTQKPPLSGTLPAGVVAELRL